MDAISKFLPLLIAQPHWAAIVVLVLLFIVLLVVPIVRVAGKRIEGRLESEWASGRIQSQLPQVEAFALIVHAILSASAALWCFFATDYPPPAMDPSFPHPLGPHANRAFGYMIVLASGAIAAMVLALRSGELTSQEAHGVEPKLATLVRSAFAQAPRAMLLGIAGSLLFVFSGAVAEPEWQELYPADAVRSLAWLYGWAAILSVGTALVLYLPLVALRWLWRLASTVP